MINEELKNHILRLVNEGNYNELYFGKMLASKLKNKLSKTDPAFAIAEYVYDCWYHASNLVAVLFDVYDAEGNHKQGYGLTEQQKTQLH